MKLLLLVLFAGLAVSALAVECSSRKVKIEETKFSSPILAGPYFLNPPTYTTVIAAAQAGEVYISIDAGRTWKEVALTGLVNGTKKGVYDIKISKNEKHVILIGYENNVWFSTDGANIFQHSPVPGRMQDFTFHPTRADWVLAVKNGCDDHIGWSCSDDLYLSTDTGGNWKLLRSYVWDYEWSVAPKSEGGDSAEPIIVVWEKEQKSGRQDREPWTSNVYRSETLFRTAPELIMYDAVGFLVVKDHIFIARGGFGEGLHLLSSENQGLTFHPVRFPLGLKESRYTILGVNEGSTFINVQHEGTNWGNVYTSNAFDTDFTFSLAHNPRGWGSGSTEFRAVEGLEGIYLASVYTDVDVQNGTGRYKQTVITYDKGGLWTVLPQPIDVECKSTDMTECGLNLDFYSWYTRDEAIGIIIGNGNIGSYLLDDVREMNTFLSRDAGWTWEIVDNSTGTFAYEIGNRGAVILSAETDGQTDKISYSLDEGKNWDYCHIQNNQAVSEQVDLDWIMNDPNSQAKSFLAGGTKGPQGVVLYIDFGEVTERACRGFEAPGSDSSDYEYWEPSDMKGDECLLGRSTRYVRRKRETQCWNVVTEAMLKGDHIVTKNCSCSKEDYECDYCFVRALDGTCEPDPECAGWDPKIEPYPCHMTWLETRGYRKVPGDSCDPSTGVDLMPIVRKCVHSVYTPTSTQKLAEDSAGFGAGLLTAIIILILLVVVVGGLYALSGRSPGVRSFVTMCVPERFLPDLVVPRANYGIMAASIDDDEDLHRDAKVIDLGDSDEDEVPKKKGGDEFDPRSGSSAAPGANVGNLI